MVDFVKVELKTIALAAGIACNLLAVGWFASELTHRVQELERDVHHIEEDSSKMWHKLMMIDRIGDAVLRIEDDIRMMKGKK